MNSTKGKLQNLRAFSGQVLTQITTRHIVGTAFVINKDKGWLVTCKHVVEYANQKQTCKIGSTVDIYFSQILDRNRRLRRAHVLYCFTQHQDDVVVLELEDSELPNEVSQAVLGSAQASIDPISPHPFRSFGYRNRGIYRGMPAMGHIFDFPEKASDVDLLQLPIVLVSQHIDRGMSGAAVLDTKRNLVVGIVTTKWNAANTYPDRDTSFATNCQVLTEWKIKLHEGDYYPQDTVSVETTSAESKRLVASARFNLPKEPNLGDAPHPISGRWIARDNIINTLFTYWSDPEVHLVGLTGFAGQGKSSAAKQWVDALLKKEEPIDGLLWWRFTPETSFEAFLQSAIEYVGGRELIERIRKKPDTSNLEVLFNILRTQRFVIIFDDLHVLQVNRGDDYGLFLRDDIEIERFLEFFTLSDFRSFCLVTTRVSLLQFIDEPAYREYVVGQLTIDDALLLLHDAGIEGNDEARIQLIQMWNGHPLTLNLIAGEIKQKYDGNIPNLDELPKPRTSDDRYEPIWGLLDYYNTHLTLQQKAFMLIFSAFWNPVDSSALPTVFCEDNGSSGINAPLFQDLPQFSDEVDINLIVSDIVRELVELHLLEIGKSGEYRTPALIQEYFHTLFIRIPPEQRWNTHINIARYYLNLILDIPTSSLKGLLDEQSILNEIAFHLKLETTYGKHNRLPREDSLSLEEILEFVDPAHSATRYLLQNGKYLLGRKLGGGGYGEIFLAYQTDFHLPVVVKKLIEKPDDPNQTLAIARFQREMEISAKLVGHHGIINIFDSGKWEHNLYFTMTLMSGGSLEQKVRESKKNGKSFTLDEISDLLSRLADIIQYVHQRGIIHRDITPRNILFDADNNPCLIDFGLAKLKGNDFASEISIEGNHIGTFGYAPPEQLQGRYKDHSEAADQYALAVNIYELITFRLPFNDFIDVFSKPPLPIIELKNEQAINRITPIIAKALALDPKDRFSSVTEFANTFADAVSSLSGRKRSKRKEYILIAIFVVVVILGVLITVLSQASFNNSFPPYHVVVDYTTSSFLVEATRPSLPSSTFTAELLILPTQMPSSTNTVTLTLTPIPTNTFTPTLTYTNTPTSTETSTPAFTLTSTATSLPVPTLDPCSWTTISVTFEQRATHFDSSFDMTVVTVGSCLRASDREVHFEGTPFRVGLNVISNMQYRQCPRPVSCTSPAYLDLFTFARNSSPVVGITWGAAMDFCRKIGGRLPTDKEWAYAALGIEAMGTNVGEWVDTGNPISSTQVALSNGAGVHDENGISLPKRVELAQDIPRSYIGFRCAFDLVNQ